jgi:hypothetical protein
MKKRSTAGLTLVEVMLAVLIAGTGIAAMVAATGRCLTVVRRAKNFETARHLIGQVEVEEPLQLKDEIMDESESGAFSGRYHGFTWQRTIVDISEAEEDQGLYEVTTRVSWSDAGRASHEEVVTYVYAPEDTGGGTVTPGGTP